MYSIWLSIGCEPTAYIEFVVFRVATLGRLDVRLSSHRCCRSTILWQSLPIAANE